MRKIVAVIGDAAIEKGELKEKLAYETGKLLVDNGFRVQSGGMGGVMEAAFCGAHASEKYREGDTVAIMPFFDRSLSNSYADIVIATGLDMYRNIIVANADAVIAVGGGSGTMSELAGAWSLKRLIVAFDSVDGWSAKVAGTRLDARIRCPEIADDKIFRARSAEEAVAIVTDKIGLYAASYGGIGK
jgi:uncharacterized protein (TIGR00725 family)